MQVSASGSTPPFYSIQQTPLNTGKAAMPFEEDSSPTDSTQQTSDTQTDTDNGTDETVSTAEQEEENGSEGELSQDEKQQVSELQARDTEVRAHEAAHIAAGAGVVTGGASFTYQTGPDGKQYAIGGEVPINMSEGSTPEATIAKMQQARAAAMAPADPSPTDYRVAASASMIEMKAQAELNKEKLEEATKGLKEKEAISAYGEQAESVSETEITDQSQKDGV